MNDIEEYRHERYWYHRECGNLTEEEVEKCVEEDVREYCEEEDNENRLDEEEVPERD
jgi:hypothetical protein